MLREDQTTRQDVYELTQSQTSIWTGQLLNPETPLYNMVYTFELNGAIDVTRFRNSFRTLIGQIDAMRTVFFFNDETPRQSILPKLDYDLEFIDLSNNPSAREEFEELAHKRSRKNFDLSKCTFDSALIKINDECFFWFLNQHHLTTDATSSSIIFKKMSGLYAMSANDNAENVTPLPDYQNYIRYEKDSRKAKKPESVSEYWRDRKEAFPHSPRFFGRNRINSTTRSKRVVIDLGIERSKALRDLANESELRGLSLDLSLFNIFATILLTYLYQIDHQGSPVFGTPVHNRITQEFKATPGLFVEFFPFVGEVRKSDTFLSLFNRVREESFEFLKNARSGLSTPETNRRFNVVLNYISTEFPDFSGVPCSATWRHPGHSDPNHHIRFHIYNDLNAESIRLFLDFNCGIFDKSNRETISGHLLQLLNRFIENPAQSITARSLLTTAEYQEIVVDFNRQEKAETIDVLELFYRQVNRNPKRTAVSGDSVEISFEDLDRRSTELASFLIQTGISDGARVSLYLPRSADLVIGILATLKAGCIFVPIASDSPIKSVKDKIRLSASSLVLTSKNLAQKLGRVSPGIFLIDADWPEIEKLAPNLRGANFKPEDLAYLIFTSGSTGTPKGVEITRNALANYINFAGDKYVLDTVPIFPFFTRSDFDLTITSIFVPLTTGGEILVYEESGKGPDLAILDVIKDNKANVIKLTPSHLALLKEMDLSDSKIETMIVGGEDFKTDLAKTVAESFSGDVRIFNEYGPSEATVGSILHRYDEKKDTAVSVPIGKPFANTKVYLLDDNLNPVPRGVAGKLYLSGESLAKGYWKNDDLTAKKFIKNPFEPRSKIYDTGDLARLNKMMEVEFLGREDEQLKIGGLRTEPGEIESILASHPAVEACTVDLIEIRDENFGREIQNCVRCGIPSNYPSASFNEVGVCTFCISFETYRRNAEKYFRTPKDLKKIFDQSKLTNQSKYDCLMLLSGGKDSTFALSQLKFMGLNVLAFTLDNGYLSDQAKVNIKRVCDELGVKHIFGKTPEMNSIFVDSLKNFKNVCNGCFKTIYTLSLKIAIEEKIPFIVTGLSRGQFFETRLTEELFWNDDVAKIDRTILEARKAYHRTDDYINSKLDTSIFQEDSVFERVRFLDFYRFFEIELEEMMEYLDEKLPWIRPGDTGRSTNCLINQVGIYVHKKEKGYSNYAFPLSWDVRMGHKTREVSLDEINEEIDEPNVKKIMREIGYTDPQTSAPKHLVAFYLAKKNVSAGELRGHLEKSLPSYMIPAAFRQLKEFPLNENGKIDRLALRNSDKGVPEDLADFAGPETEFEKILMEIWSEVLQIKIGIYDNFFELGGNSLAAIRIMTRANEAFQLDLPLNAIFESPTVSLLAKSFEHTIIERLPKL
ncbi:MAG: amino acid adenylation domain-containing protein [Pyrinomonadaceae bacterium]|nr:amino acid adenylation domain-containing protein [Pyrinomonadaceae bacterium]